MLFNSVSFQDFRAIFDKQKFHKQKLPNKSSKKNSKKKMLIPHTQREIAREREREREKKEREKEGAYELDMTCMLVL